MKQQMNTVGGVAWEFLVELNRINARTVERVRQQGLAFVEECTASAVHYLQAFMGAKDIRDQLEGEMRLARDCSARWITNVQRVLGISLQAQNELGHWVNDTFQRWYTEAQNAAAPLWQLWTWETRASRPDPSSRVGRDTPWVIDDPMLALITHFVCGERQLPLHLAEGEFIRDQIATIRAYVAQFPAEQRNMRALEWIEQHAEGYRQAWQKKAVYAQATQARCPDCPLAGEDAASCEIHQRWLALLNRYLASEVSSRGYVESTLSLLSEYKTRLKVTALREAGRPRLPATADRVCSAA
jgi:hypothetical protein